MELFTGIIQRITLKKIFLHLQEPRISLEILYHVAEEEEYV